MNKKNKTYNDNKTHFKACKQSLKQYIQIEHA